MASSRLRSAKLVLAVALQADRRRALGALAAGITASAAFGLTAYWLKILVDGAIRRSVSGVLLGAAAMGITSALVTVASRVGASWTTVLQEKAGFLIDQRLIELNGRMPATAHHEDPEYVQRLELLRSERGVFAGSVAALVASVSVIVWLLTSMTLLFSVHPVLIVLALFAVPSLVLAPRAAGLCQRAGEASAGHSRAARHLFDLATGPAEAKEVRVFGLGVELVRRHQHAAYLEDRARCRADLRAATTTAAGWAAYAVGYVGVRIFVVLRAVQHPDTTSVGDVLMVFNLSRQVNGVMERAASTLSWLAHGLAAAGRLAWLEASAPSAAAAVRSPAPVPARLEHGIDFVGVSFSYPGTEVDVLRNVNLHLPAGCRVAIVGENGVGKSTLVKLLCRFYEPTRGAILVDGTDLQHFNLDEWRRQVSGCFQDFVRFELVAREAVGIGDLDRIDDPARVNDALARVEAAGLAPGLAQGLDTQLGSSFDHGVQLSAGEWQQLALARAMMRDPLLLVLDEPAANLDAGVEHDLFKGSGMRLGSGSAAGSGAITVVVSHRFSTVGTADVVVTLHGGSVVEVGTHDDLMRWPRLYSELYGLQAHAYQGATTALPGEGTLQP